MDSIDSITCSYKRKKFVFRRVNEKNEERRLFRFFRVITCKYSVTLNY
jgi:hypothetical protein